MRMFAFCNETRRPAKVRRCATLARVSLTKRILEGAQSQLAKLTSLVIVDDEPLTHVESQALAAELAARKAAPAVTPATHPAAQLARAGQRAARAAAAAERDRRIGGAQKAEAARAKAAADEAFARMKAQAAAGPRSGAGFSSHHTGPRTASAGPNGTATGAGAGSARSAKPPKADSQVAEWYKTLGVTPGDDLGKIKTAYRQLMRKYHPDMHAGDPQKQKAATELSMKVTTAYNGLVAHLQNHG